MEGYIYTPKTASPSPQANLSSAKDKFIVWHIEGGLGKNVAATSLCEPLKNKHPDRKLILVVSYPEVFLNNPYVDRVYFVGNKPYFYQDYIEGRDTIIYKQEPYNQTGHILRQNHLIKSWCEILELQYKNQTPKLFINLAQSDIPAIWRRSKPTMVIQTNGGPLTGQKYPYSWARDMPFDLAQHLVNKYSETYHIYQITRPDSFKLLNVEVIDKPLTNIELFALLAESKKRILIDSCLQHAAAALTLPSTVLWVGTSPKVFGYELHRNITASPPKSKAKLINSYLFDYALDGVLHECPYMPGEQLFDLNEIIAAVE